MGFHAVLTYHSLDESGSPISVTPSAFAAHMRSLAEQQVRVLPLRALWEEVRSGVERDSALSLTFDDGFANFGSHAAPILSEFGFPSTLFVVTGQAGKDNRWGGHDDPGIPTLPLLDWPALEALAAAGVEIGAHTCRHSALDQLSPRALDDEVRGSADDIRTRLGVTPISFAYPYGATSTPASEAVAKSFDVAVTTEMRALDASDSSVLLPRLDAYYVRHPTGLDHWGSVRSRAYLGMRSTLRAARTTFSRMTAQ